MDIADKIMFFESGKLNQKQTIDLFKELYQTGILNRLQGFYFRTFNDLLSSGLINLKELQTEKRI